MINETKISRRDMLLMGTGLAVLCCGKFADSSINGFGADDAASLDTAVARLESIPASIGAWSAEEGRLSEREQQVAGIRGYVRRQYYNARTGYTIHLTVLCGPSGPIAVHPPTACFQGIGYSLISGPTVTNIKTEDDAQSFGLNKSAFRQEDASVPEVVRVFWGWSMDGNWQAPANPRFAFRGQPYLYKIYVTDQHLETPGEQALPQSEAFLKEALPVIAASLSGNLEK